jgi:hypothetical protein
VFEEMMQILTNALTTLQLKEAEMMKLKKQVQDEQET